MQKKLLLGAAAIALAIGGPALAQDRTSPGTDGPARTMPGKPGTTDTRADDAARKRLERLQAAAAVDKAALSADQVIGTEIRNTQDAKLGSVKDLVVQDGKISSIVIARGGVLGMGTTYHQIDIASVKMTDDKETIVLDLSDEQVKALPEVEWKETAWVPTGKNGDKASPPNVAPSAPPSTEKAIPPAGSPPARGATPPGGDKPAGDRPADKD